MAPRTDRTNSSLRALAITQSVLSRADGSAKFSFGSVTGLGSVSGPAEVRIREEIVDKATLEINVVPLRQSPAPSASFLSPLNTDPTLAAQVPPPSSVGLASGLAERSALINAAILALMDAGIECEGVLVAVSLARVGDELLLDPTPEEEASADSGHGFVFCFKGRASEPDCVGIETVGSFNEEELFEAQETAATASRAIYAFMRKSIEVRYGVTGPAPEKTEPQAMDTH